MKALILGDREAFYSSEIALREATGYPPFGRLASLVITANERHAAESYGRTLASAAPKDEQVRVLGPAEAPIAVVRGRHRFRVLVKAPRAFDLSVYLRRMARRRAQAARQCAAGGRRRSAEFLSENLLRHLGVLHVRLQQHAGRGGKDQHEADDVGRGRPLAEKMAEAVTPTTGTSSEPSEAVVAGSRPTIDHHRKCARPMPMKPL